jgi:hypothetical protein
MCLNQEVFSELFFLKENMSHLPTIADLPVKYPFIQ